MMHPDLHRYLDGDIPRDALPHELRSEAEVWDSVLDDFAELRREQAPIGLEDRVMEALPDRSAAWTSGFRRPRRVLRWFVEAHSVRVRPAVAVAAAVAAFLLVVIPGLEPPAEPSVSTTTTTTPTTTTTDTGTPAVYVQFVFTSEEARTVAVAGDFNDWNPELFHLRDPDGDGVWTGLFPLPPGLHKYMFLIDGERWETDPRAERYVDDGFGMRNAIINVALPEGRTS